MSMTGITGGGTAIQTRQYYTDLYMFVDKLTTITDHYRLITAMVHYFRYINTYSTRKLFRKTVRYILSQKRFVGRNISFQYLNHRRMQ